MNVKNSKIKKSISLFLTFAMSLSLTASLATTVSAEEATTKYTSSAYFSTGAVSNGPWTNQYYDLPSVEWAVNNISAYKDMVSTKVRNELDASPTVWINVDQASKGNYNWGNGSPYVGANVMRAATQETNYVTYNSYYKNASLPDRAYPVKTFTAPESGYVSIGAEGNMYTLDGTTHTRIMRISSDNTTIEQVWPASGYQQVNTDGYAFSEMLLSVNAGDKLTFENLYIYNSTLANTADQSVLYWDPYVEYVSKYQSSAFFSAASNPNGPWTWQFYDWDGAAYVDMAYTKADATYGDMWINHPPVSSANGADSGYTWGNNSAIVGATAMVADTSNSGNFNAAEKWGGIGRDYPVKTFTAPKGGTVKISAASELVGASDTVTLETDIRIMKISGDSGAITQVWPAGDWQHISEKYTFEDTVLFVEAGDKLTFENAYKYNSTLANTAYQTALAWDPVVEYVNITDDFKASLFFNATNPNGVWSNQYYDIDAEGTEASKYIDLQYGKSGALINHDPTVSSGSYAWGNNSVSISKELMIADVTALTDEEKAMYGQITRDYPVKTFTSPVNGVLKLSAEAALKTEQNKTNIRIMHISADGTSVTQVWPKAAGTWYKVGTEGYTFNPVNVEVKAGDKITFENAFRFDGVDVTSPWDTQLHWAPVVSYADAPYVNDITFTDTEGNELKAFADICAAGSVNVKAELGCQGANGVASAVAVVSVYNKKGELASVGLSSAQAIAGKGEAEFNVAVENIPAITKGEIKIFIFDNMTNLVPLSAIGAKAYILAE